MSPKPNDRWKRPPDPLFDAVEADLRARTRQSVAAFNKRVLLPLRKGGKAPGVPFTPQVLARSFAGDTGARPWAGPNPGPLFRDSPDVWLRAGPPSQNQDLPPLPGSEDPPGERHPWPRRVYVAEAGAVHTVYAHVWNLGLAPAGGARVDFAWASDANDVFALPVANDPHPPKPAGRFEVFGVEFVDLMPRGSAGCHRLVKCGRPWVAPMSDRPSALVVRVSAIGDPVGEDHAWAPLANRHVAAHVVTIFARGPRPRPGPLPR